MDLSVRYGHDPLWAHRLPREDMETLMAYDWMQIEQRRRADFQAKIAKLRSMGGKVQRG